MNKRNLFILIIILLGAATRFLPHPPNFTAIGALALFGGAFFSNRKLGLLLPLGALLLSDLVFELLPSDLGFYAAQPFVYIGFLLTGLLGWFLRDRKRWNRVLGMSMAGSVVFFVMSNLGVWFTVPYYPLTVEGLIACYGAAVPFFHWSVLGDLFFNTVFFGSVYLVGQRYPAWVRVR